MSEGLWPLFPNTLKLVNRVDKLTFSKLPSVKELLFNKQLQAFVLRVKFTCKRKVTLQIFVSTKTAMCFTSGFSAADISKFFTWLYNRYKFVVKQCFLCTSVWRYCLLSGVNLYKFYYFIHKNYPHAKIDYEPELFPCITIIVKVYSSRNITCRIFHSGKVNVLGVVCFKEVVEAVSVLDEMFFDFSLKQDFNNF